MPTTNDTIELSGAVELAAADGDSPTKFTISAYNGDPVQANGWRDPVIVDVASMRIPDRDIAVLRGHDTDRIVGHGRAEKTDDTVSLAGVVSADNEHSREFVSAGRSGFPWQASVGLSGIKPERIARGVTRKVNGRSVSGPAYVLRNAQLDEISVLPIGADRSTSVSIAAGKAAKGATTMTKFERWASDLGIDLEALDDSQRADLQARFEFDPSKKPDDGGNDDFSLSGGIDEIFEDARRERQRLDAIGKLSRKFCAEFPDAVDKLQEVFLAAEKDRAVTPRDVEVQALLVTRDYGINPRHSGTRSASLSADILGAGLCIGMGIDDAYDERTMQLAHDTFRGGIGVTELLVKAAEHAGHSVSHRDIPGLLDANFRRSSARFSGGFSTIDVGGVLSNVANKSAVSYFNGIEQAWREIAKIGSVRDFKTNSLYGITGASDTTFRQLSKGGEIQHGALSEYGYTVKADRFARMLALTEEDLINDDLGVLDSAAAELGIGAAEAINELFWLTYTDDSAFYSVGNSNLQDDVLDEDGLDALEQDFRAQKKPNGQPLGVTPSILLVGPQLHNTALRLMQAMGVVGDTDRMNINVFRGRYRVVSSDYVTATNWYLLADPIRPTVHVVFRDGIQAPRVERAQADFNQYGIQMRGCIDFGVAHGEPRFGQKSTGDAT